ncbi:MAG TPA: enoyl-CoA hydratase/isomerase family protein [Pyrinomonadaceae bacterium]|nr:enoyl-CoA hydratase/isomerase family protein [Pyrinomonadaceae bacterium]
MSNAIELETLQNNLIIRFSRPEIRSPLSIFVLEELDKILDEIAVNRRIKKIIFTGKADVFASGADLREIAEISQENAKDFALRGQNLMNKIAASDKLTIAAINGFCFGGALDLALSCDKRIAAPEAQFCHPGVGLGIITGWSGTQRLPRLIGETSSLEMFLTAKRIDANEALSIGLIDEILGNPLECALRKA